MNCPICGKTAEVVGNCYDEVTKKATISLDCFNNLCPAGHIEIELQFSNTISGSRVKKGLRK